VGEGGISLSWALLAIAKSLVSFLLILYREHGNNVGSAQRHTNFKTKKKISPICKFTHTCIEVIILHT
jgi:hypothetical protein